MPRAKQPSKAARRDVRILPFAVPPLKPTTPQAEREWSYLHYIDLWTWQIQRVCEIAEGATNLSARARWQIAYFKVTATCDRELARIQREEPADDHWLRSQALTTLRDEELHALGPQPAEEAQPEWKM